MSDVLEFVKHDKSRKPLPSVVVHLKIYDKDLNAKIFILNNALLDEGSQLSYISRKIVDKYNFPTTKTPQQLLVTNAANQKLAVCDVLIDGANLFVPIYKREITDVELYVMDTLIDKHAIIGLDCLRPLRRNLLCQDPYYLNKVNISVTNSCNTGKNVTYSTLLTSFDNSIYVNRRPSDNNNMVIIKNRVNVYFRPYEHKAISVLFSMIDGKDTVTVRKLQRDINVQLNPELADCFKLNVLKLTKDQSCIYLRNIVDKVVTIRLDTWLATEVCAGIQVSEVNNLIRVDSLPVADQCFYKQEYDSWKTLRSKFVKSTSIEKLLKDKASDSKCDTEKLQNVLSKHSFVFARNAMDVGFSFDFIVSLQFKHDFDGSPVYIPAYRMAHDISDKVNVQLKGMVDTNWIEKTNSPWSFPVMGVPKKGRSEVRIVQDYKRLNTLLELPQFPIPHPNTLKFKIMKAIGRLKLKSDLPLCFSILDAKSAFNILTLKKEDREYTAFTHENAQYQFKKLVQGVKSAPAIFCRFVDTFIDDMNTECSFTTPYMDDFFNICTAESYFESLELILSTFIRNGITIDLSKCKFNVTEVEFIGHVINQDGIFPLPSKTLALSELPIPKNLTEAQAFCGSFAYYTSICPRIQLILAPLSSTIGKGKKDFRMNKTLEDSCLQAKKLAKEGFGINHIDYSKPLFLVSDVSLIGIGSAFGNCSVTYDNGDVKLSNFQVVSYASRALEFTETLLSSRYRELIGISFALSSFSEYIPKYGKIYAVTDHASLINTVNMEVIKSSFTRLRKAIAQILEFPNLEVLYMSCREDIIKLADGLSRNCSYKLKPGNLNINENDVGYAFDKSELPHSSVNSVLHKPLRQSVCEVSINDIKKGQMEDEFCKNLIEKLKVMPRATVTNTVVVGKNEFCYDSNLLYRINVNHTNELVIPSQLVNELLSWLHTSTMHCGIARLKFFVNQNKLFFINKLASIQRCVSYCLYCQRSPVKAANN